ncbi:MAG: YciI family protein [Actinomycetota bacterium]
MRFIIFVIDGPNNPANPNEIEAIDEFNERLQRDGHWITAAGIAGPAHSLLIDNRSGKQEVRQGSLFDAPEYYSGFWLIEAGDEAKAKELALAGSLACKRKVELRPYL